jgi:hypothetical protein
MPENITPKKTSVLATSTTLKECPLDRRIEHNIHVYSVQSREAINKHLGELDREWSIERSAVVIGSIVAAIGIALGFFVNNWFFLLPAVILLFGLASVLFHFSPGASLLQGSGMRTSSQIDQEKFAMNTLCMDSDSANQNGDKLDLAERTIASTRKYCAGNMPE